MNVIFDAPHRGSVYNIVVHKLKERRQHESSRSVAQPGVAQNCFSRGGV